MKQHHSNDKVQHSVGCHSVQCLLAKPWLHIKVFYFQTKSDCYNAESLDAAARLWIKDGAKPLESAGSVG